MNICKITPPEATVCFTGHRRIAQEEMAALSERVADVTRRLYDAGARHFRCGGAVGFDTLAALSVLRLRSAVDRADGIRLVLVLPCADQTKMWAARDKEIYDRIKAGADEVVYASVSYSRESMLARDRALVDGAGICVAYLNSRSGGTAYTVGYAKSSGLEIINLGSREV